MDQQSRNQRKAFAKLVKNLNLSKEELYDMAFLVGILNEDNMVQFTAGDDGQCTFLSHLHSLYELTLRLMSKSSSVRTPPVDLSLLNECTDVELAQEIQRSGGSFLTVACVWLFLIVKAHGFVSRDPTGKEPPLAIASSDAQRSLFAQLCNELLKFHTEAPAGTFRLPGIKETGDAAAAAAATTTTIPMTMPTTTTWQGLTFPCSPAAAKEYTSTMLERLKKGYNFVGGGTLYSRPSTDEELAEGFFFAEEVKKGGSSQDDALDLSME